MGTINQLQLDVAGTPPKTRSRLKTPSLDSEIIIKDELSEPVILPHRIISNILLDNNLEEQGYLPLEVTILNGNKKQVLRTTVPFDHVYGCMCLARCLILRSFPDTIMCSKGIQTPCNYTRIQNIPPSFKYIGENSALCYTYRNL